jgi:hypothetical protein
VPAHADRHGLPERERRRKLFGPLTVRLSLLGRVDSHQANRRSTALAKHRDRVSVRDSDHPATEFLRPRGADKEDEGYGSERDPPERRAPTRPSPSWHGASVSPRIRRVTV